MSETLLGFPFEIHTGGIDHREIHRPNEIAQNQAHSCSDASGARIWMHNNLLVERRGKLSKIEGEVLRMQRLIDKGYNPLAYRRMIGSARVTDRVSQDVAVSVVAVSLKKKTPHT